MVAAISLPTQYGQDYINQFEAIFPTVTKQTNVPLLPFDSFRRAYTELREIFRKTIFIRPRVVIVRWRRM